ncbi:hypothetical protein [Microterricola viridarii]|uniref:Uncharacterized protein n=1 Tax=Microterricola viridarii TaxID=412690 RepID=A0A0X8E4A6_9MICO|nr:hypothetical protein [Microterricola viridarii]AMB58751.1 hypothetical protein AWU67_07615 [Microterricola viridarii]
MNDFKLPADEGSNTQDEPVMEQDAVTDREKLDGIAAQTVADLGTHDLRHVHAVVFERSTESGLHVSPGELVDAVGAAAREKDASFSVPASTDRDTD